MNNYRKVIIKIGSALINDDSSHNENSIENICAQISKGHSDGIKFAVVSSGAISQGVSYLDMNEKPNKLEELQALAAVGQQQLMKMYESYFSKYDKKIAQVLLTHDDMNNPERYLNAKATFDNLLSLDVIPVINENDVVATEEIRFGDNDTLAAMVSNMMEADLMVILTNQDGYFDKNPDKYPDAKIIKKCNAKNLNEDDFNLDEKSSVGTGGFKTKIRSVKMATTRNCPSIIASGYRKDVIKQILSKKIIGTFFYSEE